VQNAKPRHNIRQRHCHPFAYASPFPFQMSTGTDRRWASDTRYDAVVLGGVVNTLNGSSTKFRLSAGLPAGNALSSLYSLCPPPHLIHPTVLYGLGTHRRAAERCGFEPHCRKQSRSRRCAPTTRPTGHEAAKLKPASPLITPRGLRVEPRGHGQKPTGATGVPGRGARGEQARSMPAGPVKRVVPAWECWEVLAADRGGWRAGLKRLR
jgi:hypothetical protein